MDCAHGISSLYLHLLDKEEVVLLIKVEEIDYVLL